MINGECIFGELRVNIWEEFSKTSTLLNNIFSNREPHYGKPSPLHNPYQFFYGELPKYFSGIRVLGWIGILNTIYSSLHFKKGYMEIFIGYSTNHVSNMYQLFNTKTRSINVSRDISWMNVNYGMWKSRLKNLTTHK